MPSTFICVQFMQKLPDSITDYHCIVVLYLLSRPSISEYTSSYMYGSQNSAPPSTAIGFN